VVSPSEEVYLAPPDEAEIAKHISSLSKNDQRLIARQTKQTRSNGLLSIIISISQRGNSVIPCVSATLHMTNSKSVSKCTHLGNGQVKHQSYSRRTAGVKKNYNCKRGGLHSFLLDAFTSNCAEGFNTLVTCRIATKTVPYAADGRWLRDASDWWTLLVIDYDARPSEVGAAGRF